MIRVAISLGVLCLACTGEAAGPVDEDSWGASLLYTAGAGVTVEVLSGAAPGLVPLEAFKVKRKAGEWEVEAEGSASKTQTIRVTFAPGAFSGWHSHPGITLATVLTGTLTTFKSTDASCTPITIPAGSAFMESLTPTDYRFIRNDGADNLVFLATHIVPPGIRATRVDQPSPGNCPF
jgi:hypothetical protein